MSNSRFTIKKLSLLVSLLMAASSASAQTVLSPWTPLFKGIDRASGTNTPGAGAQFVQLQVVQALRVDLTDPDIRFLATPRSPSYQAEVQETIGITVSSFLTNNHLQVAINANEFNPSDVPVGTPMEVWGLLISQGVVVSSQENATKDSSAIMFTASNQVTFYPTNWPAHSTAGKFTVVSGPYPLLSNNVNMGYAYLSNNATIHQIQPRTAFGLSQDRHYLYMMTLDGRQGGYSDGAYDWETAIWLKMLGASDGVNMDGGGSVTMVMQDSTGVAVDLNHSSYIAQYGYERTVGAHFGVFAKPVPAFINDVSANPDDTAATLTWTTISPSTTQVQYGLTTNFDSSTSLQSAMVTNHAALLSGLTPGTGYYFQAISTIGGAQHTSPTFFFVTTNYLTTNQIFDMTNTWRYATTNLDGVNWTANAYDDSGWDGSGPALLWVDERTPPPNNNVQPKNTQMALDPSTGFPYITYYFRAHFTLTNVVPGTALGFSDLVDDGAVFYLNGAEIYRLRMPAPPTLIANATLATGYPCGGDANCPDGFVVSSDVATNLVAGDNVMAVEVHNYNARSPDITFGTSLALLETYDLPPVLNLASTNGAVTLNWTRGGFTLQTADNPTGPWTNVPGPIVSSPFSASISGSARYFRLVK